MQGDHALAYSLCGVLLRSMLPIIEKPYMDGCDGMVRNEIYEAVPAKQDKMPPIKLDIYSC
jgi:hypothetical protein